MIKALHWFYNIDTASVEVVFSDGSVLSMSGKYNTIAEYAHSRSMASYTGFK